MLKKDNKPNAFNSRQDRFQGRMLDMSKYIITCSSAYIRNGNKKRYDSNRIV